jgi:hypothetical protein
MSRDRVALFLTNAKRGLKLRHRIIEPVQQLIPQAAQAIAVD